MTAPPAPVGLRPGASWASAAAAARLVLVRRALDAERGNITNAAEALEISRRQLTRFIADRGLGDYVKELRAKYGDPRGRPPG